MHIIQSPLAVEEYSAAANKAYLVVDCTGKEDLLYTTSKLPHPTTCPVIALVAQNEFKGDNDTPAHWADMVLTDTEAQQCIATILRQPVAAATLVQVTRSNSSADIHSGLLTESLAYSTLQQSAGFRKWLSQPDKPKQKSSNAPLLWERIDNRLYLTFNRPEAHNAFNVAIKDELCTALHLAHADREITHVHLRGNGPSFCAGGDLSEFGSVDDAALAHLSRTTRSAGELIATLECRSEFDLHGVCMGAGIELPAFADHVRAHPKTTFALPEIAMGLIPGAGGTVSIVKRIGIQKTNYFALCNSAIDATLALSWGLIDEIID